MNLLDRINRNFNNVLVFVAGLFLMGMIGLTCLNIVLRLVWRPIPGTYELMGYFGSIAAGFALGYTQIRRGHISVDILVNSFSPKIQRLLGAASSLICAVFFVLAAWQLALKAGTLWRTGEVTETLRIAYYPFTYAVALGCIGLFIALTVELVHSLLGTPYKDGKP
jgi:TRAP-type C4-dicarboxylate transport system permease small subunit